MEPWVPHLLKSGIVFLTRHEAEGRHGKRNITVVMGATDELSEQTRRTDFGSRRAALRILYRRCYAPHALWSRENGNRSASILQQ